MNDYTVFYNGKQVDIKAPTLYEAKLKGIAHFKPPKSKQHLVTPVLNSCPEASLP